MPWCHRGSDWKFRLKTRFGTAGIIISLLLSIVIAGQTFLHPRAPFAVYESDTTIGLIYLLIFLVAGILFLLKTGRVLSLLALGLAAALLLVAMRTWGGSLLLLFWIVWLSWGLGKQLFKRIIPLGALLAREADVLSLALGWGALMVLTFLLGVIGLYQRSVFYALLVVLSSWGAFSYFKDTTTPRKLLKISSCFRAFVVGIDFADALTLFLFVLLAAGSFFWALAPAVRYDALGYHLAAPMRYLDAGRMLELPESFQTYSAHYGEMLYTLALGLGEQPLPTLLNFSAGLLLAAQTYFIGRRLGNHRTGLIAALILYSLPIIGIESATAYTDIFVAVFVTAALQAFLLWRDQPNNRWLLLKGIFSGLALGTKLNAFFLLLPFWVWAFITKTQNSQRKTKIQTLCSSCLRVLLLGLPALLLWLPWLLRDFIWTGNPIFPNYNQIFHSPDWFVAPFFRIQPTGGIAWRMLAFPWAGITDSYRYYHEAPGAVLGALPLLGLPWLYGWRGENRKLPRGLLLVFAASLVMIFAFGGSIRYLMPLFPLLSALAALNIQQVFLHLSKTSHTQKKRIIRVDLRSSVVVFFALGLLYIFSTRLAFTARWWEIPERYPVGIWLGTEMQEEFIERILPVYGAFEYLDQLGQFKVFSVGNELRLYTDSAIYGPLFSKEAYELLQNSETPAALAESLARNGYDYVLFYPPEAEFRPDVYASPALSEEFFNLFTTQVYAQRDVYLYALNP